MDLRHIDILKAELDKLRPLPVQTVKSIKSLFDVELTYNSNAIEGSTLSYSETKIILLDGITIGGKTTREHLEAINHKEAIDYIEEIAGKGQKALTRSDVLGLHSIILRGIDTPNAGKFRDVNVYVMQSEGEKHMFPAPVLIPGLMDEFFDWLKTPQDMHPVRFSAEAHYRLVSIHPFVDGNGRTARLLMNLILLQNGFTPAVIKMSDRVKYIDAIEQAQKHGTKEPFYDIVSSAVQESLEMYLKTIKENIVWK
jgi:Fic family protein